MHQDTQWSPLTSYGHPHWPTFGYHSSSQFHRFFLKTDTNRNCSYPHLKQVWKGANMQVVHSSSKYPPAPLPQQLFLYPAAVMGGRKHHLFGLRGKSQWASYLTPWQQPPQACSPVPASTAMQPSRSQGQQCLLTELQTVFSEVKDWLLVFYFLRTLQVCQKMPVVYYKQEKLSKAFGFSVYLWAFFVLPLSIADTY